MLEYFYSSILLYYFNLLDLKGKTIMCKKRLKTVQDKIKIAKETITFFSNKSIIEKIIKIIEKENRLNSNELKKSRKDFKESIERHFDFIVENEKDNKTEFNDYKIIVDSLYDEYCDFYKSLISEINKMTIDTRVSENYKAYINFIKKHYCL